MISRLLTLILVLSIGHSSYAQYTYFNTVSGTSGDMIPEGVQNVEVQGDEIVIMGVSSSGGIPYQFLRRYNSEGIQINQSDYSFDKGFIYTGRTSSFQSIPGTDDFLFSHAIIASGETQGYIAYFNSDLDSIWSRCYNDYSPDTYFYTHVHTDDGFLLAGENGGSGERGIFVMKIDIEGNVLWHNEVHDPSDGVLYRNVTINTYGDLIILTGASGLGIDTQSTIDILDSEGNLLKHLEALGGIANGVMYQVQSEDEDLLFTVQMAVESHPGSPPEVSYTNLFLYTINFTDTTLVQVAQYFENEDWLQGFPRKMIKISDGYVLLGGYLEDNPQQNQRGWIMKIDESYEQEWYTELAYEDLITSEHRIYDVEQTSDGGFVCVGIYNTDFDPYERTWLVKLDACGDLEWQGCEPVGVEEWQTKPRVTVYPNPTSDFINIDFDADLGDTFIELHDLSGRKVLDAENVKEVDVSSLVNGIYLLQVFDENKMLHSEKVVVD